MSRGEAEESDWETAADKEEDEWEKSVSQIAFGGLAVREDVEDEVWQFLTPKSALGQMHTVVGKDEEGGGCMAIFQNIKSTNALVK